MPDALRLPPAREGGLDPHHLVHHHFSKRRCFAPFAGTGEPPVEALLPLTPASAIDWPTRKRWIKSSMPASGGVRGMVQSLHHHWRRNEHPMSEPEPVDPSQLRPGPIRHGSLPSELLEQIKAVFDVIGPYVNMTLEPFEIGFMRDMHPESEVAFWCGITAAWLAYHKKYLGEGELPDEGERKLLAALIAISTGLEDPKRLGVAVEVGRRLLECYDGLSKE
jgi:hypothetical protein